MSRRIILTAAWLRQHDACPEPVAAFRRLFGEAAEVCPETLDMAVTAGLSVAWLGRRVLTDAESYRVAVAAWEESYRVAVAAREESYRVAVAAIAALLADPANWKPEVLAELRRDV